ncbi:MAG TPA: molybdopterin-binding protein [Steroidobacteraceae bacterium]|nr:molybdopterin-binding protein [Steroidobacteraceae bacterium]
MKFGPLAVSQAVGAVLAHSVKLNGGALKKGTVLAAADIQRLQAAGIASVVAARLDADDVPEDMAAARIAAALAGAEVETGTATTGRVNLYARQAGLLRLDAARVHAANRVHEGLTIATLLPDSVVEEGQMLATVKIIPYAVPAAALRQVIALLGGEAPALRVAPWLGIRAALVMTRAGGTSPAVLAKMRGAVLGRLGPLGGSLIAEIVVPHEEQAVAAALRALRAGAERPQLLLVSGVAATVDRGDIVPAAVLAAGGRVLHAGMPVDPGNLLVLAELGDAGNNCPLIGIPTCARSPKLNGFDFVLRRYAAGESVSREDIMAMGVGGLLTEIETRPMPRDTRRRQASD